MSIHTASQAEWLQQRADLERRNARLLPLFDSGEMPVFRDRAGTEQVLPPEGIYTRDCPAGRVADRARTAAPIVAAAPSPPPPPPPTRTPAHSPVAARAVVTPKSVSSSDFWSQLGQTDEERTDEAEVRQMLRSSREADRVKREEIAATAQGFAPRSEAEVTAAQTAADDRARKLWGSL